MSRSEAVFGIRPEAFPAWHSLAQALEDMADRGQSPVCQQQPHQWSEEADEPARGEAAEACAYCPALDACGAFADINREPSGVWGGVDRTPARRTKNRKAA